jgi:hypothetical protein
VEAKNLVDVIELHVNNFRTLLELAHCVDIEITLSSYRKALHSIANLAIQEFILRSQEDLLKVRDIIKK